MIGKIDQRDLEELVFTRTGNADPAVIQGPAYGEDTAAIDLGEHILVINADPLSMAAEDVGTLAVHVACNDIAASGATPRWITNTMFLPEADRSVLDTVTAQVDSAAREIGVAIVGGHAEVTPDISRPLLSMAAFGVTDRYIPSGGASPGDRIILAGGAGIEATAILAEDFGGELRERGIDEAVLDRAAAFVEEISVVDAALAVREFASAMHDPTEGGVLSGLLEMAVASGVTFEVNRENIPVRSETRRCCSVMGVDPLCVFGSGGLLVAVPPVDGTTALQALVDEGVEAADIGHVTAGDGTVRLDGEEHAQAPRDELYPLWE